MCHYISRTVVAGLGRSLMRYTENTYTVESDLTVT